MDKAKEDWIYRVAREGEAAVKDERARWDSIRRLQQAHSGRRPTRLTAVVKEDGVLNTRGKRSNHQVVSAFYEGPQYAK